MALGQRRRRSAPFMPDRTPTTLASYEAANTTPVPTTTGFPLRLGSSRCSTEA